MSEDFQQFPQDYFGFDKSGLLGQYANITADIKAAYELGATIELPQVKEDIDHIFFIGMGGSGIGGQLIKLYLSHLKFSIPITVINDYDIPLQMTPRSYVFVTSYSGNTEETISAYRQALRITQNIVVVASGGKLEEMTKVTRKPFLKIPKGFQPRTAAGSYLTIPFIRMLERLGLIPPQKEDIVELCKGIVKPDFKEHAIAISEKLYQKIPIVYSSQRFFPLAYRFKTQINENAKVHAFTHTYSEFNHNEILGYENLLTDYHIVTFRFDEDHKRIQKRMDIIKSITNSKGIATTEIRLKGNHFPTKIFSALLLGDLISYYLALRYKIDPSPVDIIESLKENLGPFI